MVFSHLRACLKLRIAELRKKMHRTLVYKQHCMLYSPLLYFEKAVNEDVIFPPQVENP